MQIKLSIILMLLVGGCSSGPVNPSFSITFDQARAAVDEMREQPVEFKRPLVIIGGFADPNVSPPLYKIWFQRVSRDSKVIPVSVGMCQSFACCREKVIGAIDEACPNSDPNWTTEVDIVGASLGGLVGRFAAAPSPDPDHPRRVKVANLFSIGSPHSGARLAQSIPLIQFHRDMKPGSEFLRKLAETDSMATYNIFPYTRLDDGMVGEKNAAPPGQNPIWIANTTFTFGHAGAMLDERILVDIARHLRGEAAFSKPPYAKLPE